MTNLFQTAGNGDADDSMVPVPLRNRFVRVAGLPFRQNPKNSILICAICASLAALYLVVTWPTPPPLSVIPKPAVRQSPDISGVPMDLPQSGAWRGENAFPHLTFSQPLRLNHIPGTNQLCVFEREGMIVRFENDPGTREKEIFLDLREKILDDHRGPICMAFHPEFGIPASANRDYVFLFYKRNDGYDVVSRFTVLDSQTADPESELLLIEQLSSKTHAGGAVVFGHDGFLYVASGEERHTDQTIDLCLHGGVFRIDVDMIGGDVSHPPPRQPDDGFTQNYFIPNDNPFVGRPSALEEFWALGLRNPFTMTTDSETGEIWIGEVGRDTWEEVNRLAKGANYEWSYREGNSVSDRMDKPSDSTYIGNAASPYYSYLQSESNNSVIGGYVYRGNAYPELYGKYVFSDNGSSRIWAATTGAQADLRVDTLCQLPCYRFEGVSSFGEDADGELYVCVLGRSRYGRPGRILKLVPNETGVRSGSRHTESEQATGPVTLADQADLPKISESDASRVQQISYERTSGQSAPVSISPRLSDTGLFINLKTLQPATGVIPYTINSPLWSDNAIKRRWIAVPGDGTSDDPTVDRVVVADDFPYDVSFPAGTVFVKHFELPVDENDPNVTLRLETRVTVLKAGGGFCGMTYRWNEPQTEAFLIDDREFGEVSIRTRSGRTRIQRWTFPSRADCRMCHNTATGYVLGVNVPQLNCSVIDPEGGEVYSQLSEWNERGIISARPEVPCSVSEFELSTWPKMVSVNDETASLEDRVRSYLAVNCSQCHRKDIPGRPPRPVFDLRYHVPLADRGLVGDLTVVVPGRPSKSRLLARLSTTDHQRMPPIGRGTVDEYAVGVIRKWINSLD